MKTFVNKKRSSGIDWTGSNTESSFLEENGSWSIEDPEQAVIADIHREISGMGIDTTDPETGKQTRFTLNAPPPKDIADCYRNKKTLHVSAEYRHGGREEQLGANWDPVSGILTLSYLYGGHDEEILYDTVSIPEEKILYIPVEVFHTPDGYVRRMRTRAFAYGEENEAKRAYREIGANLWGPGTGCNSAAGIQVANKDELGKWYENNLKAVLLRERHPEIKGFRIDAGQDIRYLNSRIKKQEE